VISCGGVNTNTVALDLGPNLPYDDVTIVKSDDVPDNCDADDDADGIPEYAAHVGLWNESVFPILGCPSASAPTDVKKMDSDGDHLTDGWECANGSDPSSAASKFVGSGFADADGDHVFDVAEERGYAGSGSSTDSDGDGCADIVEVYSVDNTMSIGDGDRIIVARRALGILPPHPALDYVVDVDRNGFVQDTDRILVARAVFFPDWQPKTCM
jgi:hypothetical protein